MPNKQIKVGIVGAGQIAQKARIPAYLHNEYVNMIALVDIDHEKVRRVAKRFGLKYYFSSVDELFEKLNVDAVTICTPPNTHADIALKALSHGAHVFCEKPIATRLDDAKKMLEASEAEERILMVGFNRRFYPNYQKAKEFTLRGKLGHVYCVGYHSLQPSPLMGWSKSSWFYEPGVGGVLLDLGSHVFDMLNYIFGDFPRSVSANSSTYLDSPVEDSCICVLEYPGKKVGVGVMSWLAPAEIENLSIHGTAQSLFVSPNLFLEVNPTDILEVSLWRKANEMIFKYFFPNFPLLRFNKVDTFQLEIDHFVKQIRENKTFSSNALDALNVLLVCDAARRALETNEKIKLSYHLPCLT